MAIFPSVVSYLLQQISIRDIGPSRTMAFVNMVPVFSMAMAFLILGETITTVKIIAVLVIIAGVSINSRLKTDRA
jgi:drug/metabolite transporter (DMT)-like permease